MGEGNNTPIFKKNKSISISNTDKSVKFIDTFSVKYYKSE